MRPYLTNSPEAAARVLAMALIADGHYALSELRALDRLEAPRTLGLTPEAFKGVVDRFCEDLLLAAGGEWLGSAQLDDATRHSLMAEVTDPALQRRVWALSRAVVEADGHLVEGEVALLDAMAKAWGFQAEEVLP